MARAVAQKSNYHHGDLKEALISAAYDGIRENGAENFSLADVCKLAGVSTAAPYRHFKDRDALLAEVVKRGFDTLTYEDRKACESAGEGTVEGIIALGRSYARFAEKNPGLFRLMFGPDAVIGQHEFVQESGAACFGYVIGQVTLFCEKNKIKGDALAIATSLWTFVHGMSSLTLDGKYAKVTPDVDVDEMLRRATPQLLGIG